MEYSNEFLARVYAAYMGCEVRYMGSDGIPDPLFYDSTKDDYCFDFVISGIRREGKKSYTLYGDMLHDDDTVDEVEIDITDAKLLLTPLSAITDEHAIEVAKMYKGERLLLGEDGFAQVIYKDSLIEYFLFTHPLGLPCRLTDYLRSKGYDTGFAEIPSLIDAGLAIDKTTLNN